MTTEDLHTLRPAASYTADFEKVLWWHLPVAPCSAPVVSGSLRDRVMLAGQPVSWYTHWSPLPEPFDMISENGVQVLSDELVYL